MTSARRDGLALAFASLFPLLMAWLYFVALAGDPRQGSSLLAGAYALGKLIQFPFPILYVLLFETARPTWKWPTRGDLGWALGFALLVDLGMAALYLGWLRDAPWLADTPARIMEKLHGFHVATPGSYLLLGLFLCMIHSLLEEYYWRWFVFGRMHRHLSFAWAGVLSSLAFMLHHVVILGVYFPNRFWTLAVPFSLAVAVGGFAWAWLYRRNGSLLAPWLSHALIDAGILLVGYDMVRGLWS